VRLGFIGVGTITEAVVIGLQDAKGPAAIHLSPRSEATSRRLASAYPSVFREESNAAVVEKSDMVVLAMRPGQIGEALFGVRFRPSQIVVSFAAAVTCAEVAAVVAPAASVCRMTPLPTVAQARGPILLYPPIGPVVDLFGGLGDLILPSSEAELRDLACASGFMSSFFELQSALAGWLVEHEVDRAKASLYVRSMLAALGDLALDVPAEETDALAPGHETKGGLNERVRRTLTQQGWFAAAGHALASLQTLKGADLTEGAKV